jgi:hypothetical protein
MRPGVAKPDLGGARLPYDERGWWPGGKRDGVDLEVEGVDWMRDWEWYIRGRVMVPPPTAGMVSYSGTPSRSSYILGGGVASESGTV